MEKTVLLRKTDGIALVALNRPEAYNSFDLDMVRLVTEVVDDGDGMNRAVELIRGVKKGSLSSFAASKKLITDSFNTPFETQLENERNLLSWAADQPDGREGIAAFLEKRKPVFGKL